MSDTPTTAAMRLVADVEAAYSAACRRVLDKNYDHRLADIIERTDHKVTMLRHTIAEREARKI